MLLKLEVLALKYLHPSAAGPAITAPFLAEPLPAPLPSPLLLPLSFWPPDGGDWEPPRNHVLPAQCETSPSEYALPHLRQWQCCAL